MSNKSTSCLIWVELIFHLNTSQLANFIIWNSINKLWFPIKQFCKRKKLEFNNVGYQNDQIPQLDKT